MIKYLNPLLKKNISNHSIISNKFNNFPITDYKLRLNSEGKKLIKTSTIQLYNNKFLLHVILPSYSIYHTYLTC